MHYTEPIMKPPVEAYSVRIEAIAGCSRNKSTFCGAYRNIRFQTVPMEQIYEDIQEAAAYYINPGRVFLLSGDAFALSYQKLSQIAAWIRYDRDGRM